MKEHSSLSFVIVSIFVLLGMGAYLSPSYTQQIGYAQGFLLAGAVLFIASIVIVVATLGFHTFALYIAVLAGMAIASFGIYGGLLVIILTYITWGFAFSIELLLVHNDTSTAIEWFEKYYTFKTFKREYYAFYPILWIMYFLLDIMPYLFYRDRIIEFRPRKVLEKMARILP
jgi:hypothetical protein